MKFVYLMTKNAGKIKAANGVFSRYGIEVRPCPFEIPEIQADTSIEIAKAAVIAAYERLQAPCIREDHSFFIDALGMPGPYMAYVEQHMPLDTVLRMLKGFDNRNCHWEVATAYMDAKQKVHEFVFQVPAVFVEEPRGADIPSWIRAVRFPEETRVLTEYPEEERLHVWQQNYEQIALLLSEED
jgi:XTP/dITP diphosphohydrolase